jgi:membrane-associated phospholipid phosphatase
MRPAFSDRVGRLGPILGLVALHLGGYVLATEAAFLRPPSAWWDFSLPLDRLVPHLPWTWPFYLAAYPFVGLGGAAVLLALPERGYRRGLAANVGLILSGATLQIAFPAHAPVPPLPHPAHHLIHWSELEKGFATFPSMHVALCVMTALVGFHAFRSRAVRVILIGLAAGITLSTMALHEHVILDAVGGVCLGAAAFLLWRRGLLPRAERPDAAVEAGCLDLGRLYRLPWSAADNAMTWLEPTRRCNITCDACFAENDPRSQKPLERIRDELAVLMRERRCDAMLIAGGEPLTHPDIEPIVRMVKAAGVKPVVVTNGVLLDRPLVRRLRRAGVHGFTLHVDRHQARPGYQGASERELNELRSHFADLLFAEGRLVCTFNTTVFPDSLEEVKEIVAWAIARPERVHVLTLICVRLLEVGGGFDYHAGGRAVDLAATPYAGSGPQVRLTAEDLLREVRKVLPGFQLNAYLGGTALPHSPKWSLGSRLAAGGRTVGYAGPRAMELFQTVSHLARGRYLAYPSSRTSRMGRVTLLLGVVDPWLRRAALGWLTDVLRHPLHLVDRLHVQNLSVLQPVDILPNGELDGCDGCPNKTCWDGRLVSACQLDGYRRFGAPIQAVPRARVQVCI